MDGGNGGGGGGDSSVSSSSSSSSSSTSFSSELVCAINGLRLFLIGVRRDGVRRDGVADLRDGDVREDPEAGALQLRDALRLLLGRDGGGVIGVRTGSREDLAASSPSSSSDSVSVSESMEAWVAVAGEGADERDVRRRFGGGEGVAAAAL